MEISNVDLSWVEWFFSGAGVFILGYFIKRYTRDSNGVGANNNSNVNNVNVVIPSNGTVGSSAVNEGSGCQDDARGIDWYKNNTKIVFVDDDSDFKVANILRKSGWVHTRLINDCETLEDNELIEADILFIDVQGVGVSMGFSDEGLGLALAIKEKYNKKKVVIYSAETNGDRFHEALRKADFSLAKNADPYQFQELVEEFTIGSCN